MTLPIRRVFAPEKGAMTAATYMLLVPIASRFSSHSAINSDTA